jgi:hypothetical protein
VNTMATFTVKVSASIPAVRSAEVQAWLRGFSSNGNADRIASDPGAGDRVLRLSLPEDQVIGLAAKLGDPPAVALRRLIATYIHGSSVPLNAQVVRGRTRSTAPASWFDRHPILAFVLTLAGIGLLLWLLFRRSSGPPVGPGPSAPPLLVSAWSPLQ